ncbi:MAG: hypothetical protein A3J07_03545 [Candidatus Doudnabacteria bacterium RIFCSPLOWO2_02_FULL_49_13]|uniref:Adenylate kinase n=1 Tax=Candidatus Doudnabacteria bacterium RIFCSPHIGHO2_12_FULL_48_16 TaxID=1817838 RepID=A0A1F5PJL6_9BACT|nr:MAG: hypothetical protein A3B77_02345 [Candidatus Doudnabacteria bacterium RIFCSPHIGHO2_02_FULL_49_24]OGE89875.1 MAG: hypothetical protein A2760_03940 [Candidatus Doudnabacteria bacterium RIFCSPHIGHO2_01_FULL_50_67]OGE89994.1 MAG: hypothetical protein A3E29_02685 [Candidatus Doudnabacteria bacterium RIFCSPHIGHO2_12_FULL_48_16]OGE97461.1 MAG: hypothetical protein A2990_01950 [Candidatus Doudnabacteria bacterium RIFCSPLOWO2_01_FULL_49_40]OGF03138.1 MAG: hypothetical protein A3J07_03545 [Candid
MKKLGFDLIFLGAPASGKDTQARLLANHYELKRVESGEYFRRHIRDKSAFGKTLRRTVGQAKPAPVAVMKIFLTKEIQIAPKKKNLVFVGNPKLKPEAQFLVKLLKKHSRDFLAFYVKLPVKEIIKRSFYRMRHDDLRKALIERRINWHKKQVGQTVKYFQALGKLKFINGNQHIFKVTRDIQKTINDYARSQANRTT